MSLQILLDATSQTLAHVPPGRVASATFVLEDLAYGLEDGSRVLASGSCTVASWSLTTSAAAGPSVTQARRLSTASTTGAAIGDPAVVTAADGSREIIEIAAISTNAYVEASTSLASAYASGSTVKGIKITAAIPDLVAADEDLLEQHHPLRIVWEYTLDGVLYRAQHPVEFVRQASADLALGPVLLELKTLYPDIANRMPDGTSFDTVVARLGRSIRVDLRSRGIDPERWMLGEAAVDLYVARVLAHAGNLGYAPGDPDQAAWAKWARDDYRRQLEALTIGTAGRGVYETKLATDTSPGTDHKARSIISRA